MNGAVLYQYLINQCNEAIEYWSSQSDEVQDKYELIRTYTNLCDEHKRKLELILSHKEVKSDIEKFIEQTEKIFNEVSEYLPKEIKKFFETILKIAKNLLKEL
jgi:hypothetical protein